MVYQRLCVLQGRFFSTGACKAIFVGGLSRDTNEIALRDAFKQHGDIVKVRVVCDRVTSNSKRYGFISFTSESEARTAIQKMDGQLLDGRRINVSYAHKG